MSRYLIVHLRVLYFRGSKFNISSFFFSSDSSKLIFFLHRAVLFYKAIMCVPIKVRYGVLWRTLTCVHVKCDKNSALLNNLITKITLFVARQ